jgi:hypothetical protein
MNAAMLGKPLELGGAPSAACNSYPHSFEAIRRSQTYAVVYRGFPIRRGICDLAWAKSTERCTDVAKTR